MREEELSFELSRVKADNFELESTLKATKVKLESTAQLLTEQSHLNSSLIAKTDTLEAKVKGMQTEAAHERARAIGIEREMQRGTEEREVSHQGGLGAKRDELRTLSSATWPNIDVCSLLRPQLESSRASRFEASVRELRSRVDEGIAREERLRTELASATSKVAEREEELREIKESSAKDREVHALQRSSSQEQLGSVERRAEEKASKLESDLEARVREAKSLRERVEESEKSKDGMERRLREGVEKARELSGLLEKKERELRELRGEKEHLGGEVKYKAETLEGFKKRLSEVIEENSKLKGERLALVGEKDDLVAEQVSLDGRARCVRGAKSEATLRPAKARQAPHTIC